MTYFGFLLRFLIIPILILLVLLFYSEKRGQKPFASLRSWSGWAAIALHILIAVIYTTPWDNYLVATRVWWYDPNLVTGITFGWVPIEEYTFFVLQPIMTGLWLLLLTRYLDFSNTSIGYHARSQFWVLVSLAVLWLLSIIVLVGGWKPGTYLALELGWAVPPVALQVYFGWDILIRYRRLVLATLIPTTLYLSMADALAIDLGTWTIDPAQSLHFLIGGILPIEEFIFFMLTNVLVTFGITLILAEESHVRLSQIRDRTWPSRRPRTIS
ncbi:MAG: lycopene cyclase domain-containing protein [Chloroflexota bacterium]